MRRIATAGMIAALVAVLPAIGAYGFGAPCTGDQLNFTPSPGTPQVEIVGTGPDAGTVTEVGFAPISLAGLECLVIDIDGAGTAATVILQGADWDAFEFISVTGDGDDTVDFTALTDLGSGEWRVTVGTVTNLGLAATTGSSRFEVVGGGTISLGSGPALVCSGAGVTIAGGPGADVWNGTPGPDVIHVLGGNDTINGLNGDDRLCGGDGDDVLLGRAGMDHLIGGSGADELRGHEGADLLGGGPGDDRAWGGADADRLFGADDVDILRGGPGDDEIFGGAGSDVLQGDPGVDLVNGGSGADVCSSGETVKNCEA